jgi:phosphopantothenoylcysteine decarboxylase/phosphopantothenate--cysteine ligase
MRPATGRLTGVDSGIGRLPDTSEILSYLASVIANTQDLTGKRVLVTAGGTREAIDPVRYIGNRSSGKMGVAIADEFAKQGATVTLVLGPSHQKPLQKNVKVIPVESAEEMLKACATAFENCHIAVLSAAVADYKPAEVSKTKIKKKDTEFTLALTKTIDVLETLGQLKTSQLLVGFALETNNIIEYAKEKIIKKNLDFIIANSAIEKGAGFGVDTNKITIIDKHNNLTNFELKTKQEVAKDIVNFAIHLIKRNV